MTPKPSADARALKRLARFMERHAGCDFNYHRIARDGSEIVCADPTEHIRWGWWRLPRAYRARAKRKG